MGGSFHRPFFNPKPLPMKPFLKNSSLLIAIALASCFGLGLLVGNMRSPEQKFILTALKNKKDSPDRIKSTVLKESADSASQVVPDAAPAIANQVPATSSTKPSDTLETRTEYSSSVARYKSDAPEETQSKRPAASDKRITSNSVSPTSFNSQPQQVIAGLSIPRPGSSSIQKTAPNNLSSTNSESPSSKGNSVQFAGQKVTIEAAGNVGGKAGLALDVAITPVDATTAISTQATSPKGAVNLEYGGLSYEEFRFRQLWGWAAFDAARRAAKSVANGQ